MPAVSKKQQRYFGYLLSNPEERKKKGISKKAAKDFAQDIQEVSPPGWGHTKAEKEKTKPWKPKSKIGGTAAAFKRALDDGRFKGLPGSTTKKEKTADMFKLMWAMKKKGDNPHYKPGTDKKYKKYQKVDEALVSRRTKDWPKGSIDPSSTKERLAGDLMDLEKQDKRAAWTVAQLRAKKKKYQEDWKPKIEHIKGSDLRKKAAEKKRKEAADSLPPHLRLDTMKKAFSQANEATTMQDNNLFGDAYAGLKKKIGSKKKHNKPAIEEGIMQMVKRATQKKKEERKPKKAMDAGARARRALKRREHAQYVSDIIPKELEDQVQYYEENLNNPQQDNSQQDNSQQNNTEVAGERASNQLKSQENRQKMIKKQVLLKKLQAVRAGAHKGIVAHYEPEGELVEGVYERRKTKEVIAALKRDKRNLPYKTKASIARRIVADKGDTSRSDDRYAYEEVQYNEGIIDVIKKGAKRHAKAVEKKKIKNRKAVPYAALGASYEPEGEVLDEADPRLAIYQSGMTDASRVKGPVGKAVDKVKDKVKKVLGKKDKVSSHLDRYRFQSGLDNYLKSKVKKEEVELDERLGGKGYKPYTSLTGKKVSGDWEDSDRGGGHKWKKKVGKPVEKKSPTYRAYVLNKEDRRISFEDFRKK